MAFHQYKIIETDKDFKAMIAGCKKTGYCSFDFESNGVNPSNQAFYLTLMSVSFQPGFSYVLPLGHSESPFKKSYKKLLRVFAEEVLADTNIIKIAFNLKYEMKCLFAYNLDMKGRLFDAMLAKYLLNEERPNDLGSVVRLVLGDFSNYKDDTQGLAAKHGWANIPIKELSERCALDSDLTLRLMIHFEAKLIKNGFYKLFRNLLMPNVRNLAESEFRGIDINVPYLHDLEKKYLLILEGMEKQLRNLPLVRKYEEKRLRKVKKQLILDTQLEIDTLIKQGKAPNDRVIKSRQKKISNYIAGNYQTKKEQGAIAPLNFGSPAQLKDILFYSKWGLKFKVVKYTIDKATKKPTDNASTDEEVLMILSEQDDSGFIKTLLDLRGERHLYNTYIKGTIEKLVGSKLHANYLIHGTVTGRLSSTEPNMQNVPRMTTNPHIKPMFLPPNGFLILEVDYSQAELRLVAELAVDRVMIDIFKRGFNIHLATACKLNGGLEHYDEARKAEKDETHKRHLFWVKQKKRAKMVNFGILYGQGPAKLANEMDCSIDEAKKFIANWLNAYPGIKKWIKNQHRMAHEEGYVYNIFGRKRRLPDAELTENEAKALRMDGKRAEAFRQSVNAPIQGGSSDLCQLAAVEVREQIHKGLLPKDLVQLYTVHDSLGYAIRPEDIHDTIPKIVEICNNPNTLKWFGFEMIHVNMKVSPEIGINWGSLEEYQKDKNYTLN